MCLVLGFYFVIIERVIKSIVDRISLLTISLLIFIGVLADVVNGTNCIIIFNLNLSFRIYIEILALLGFLIGEE